MAMLERKGGGGSAIITTSEAFLFSFYCSLKVLLSSLLLSHPIGHHIRKDAKCQDESHLPQHTQNEGQPEDNIISTEGSRK